MGGGRGAQRLYRSAKRRLLAPTLNKHSSQARQRTFQDIYADGGWGGHGSGPGATLEHAGPLIAALPALLAELSVKTLLDIPCGDWQWMRHVDLTGIDYVGIDIVPEVIDRDVHEHSGPNRRFLCLDAVSDTLPAGDAILSRAFFIHLADELVWKALANFRTTGAKWLMASYTPDLPENTELKLTGSFRPINLRLPPFNFPEPVRTVEEHAGSGRPMIIGVFDLAAIPQGRAGAGPQAES